MIGPYTSPDDIAICLPPGVCQRFVATDGLSGWFEGFSHSRSLGSGYMPGDRFVFRSWRSFINHRLLDRESAALRDRVFPWGHSLDYPDAREELVLHQGRRILSLRVTAAVTADLRIEVEWAGAETGRQWQAGSDYSWSAPDHEAVAASTNQPEGHPGALGCCRFWIARLDEIGSDSLCCHLVFGESQAEMLANLVVVRTPGSLDRQRQARWDGLNASWFRTGHPDYDQALWWAAASARSLVTHEFGTGIWAGLPWFKDNWGRDTFIALPGTLLCTGQFATARAVLEDFASRQNLDPASSNYGRIPNRVTSRETIYNTVDGTPWLIRELDDYRRWTGDIDFARTCRPLIRRYVEGALRYFVDDQGLMTHDDADTWMDARIANATPWSPRGDRAVEIQALWFTALRVGAELARADGDEAEAAWYQGLAERVRVAFAQKFVADGLLVDHLNSDGSQDRSLRPNVLMAATIPPGDLVEAAVITATTRRVCETLILPRGVLSLAPGHRDFHPCHENPTLWHKDAAYHNGTIWGWNAGFAISALVGQGWQERAWKLSQNLAGQILGLGAVGTMSELLDACLGPEGQPVPSGTFSQAWSVSEFVRVAWEDYLGFRPDLPGGCLVFRPALPRAWPGLAARLRFGQAGQLQIRVSQTLRADGTARQKWRFSFGPQAANDGGAGRPPLPSLVIISPGPDGSLREHSLPKGKTAALTLILPAALDDGPKFAPEPDAGACTVMQGRDVLMRRLQSQSVDKATPLQG